MRTHRRREGGRRNQFHEQLASIAGRNDFMRVSCNTIVNRNDKRTTCRFTEVCELVRIPRHFKDSPFVLKKKKRFNPVHIRARMSAKCRGNVLKKCPMASGLRERKGEERWEGKRRKPRNWRWRRERSISCVIHIAFRSCVLTRPARVWTHLWNVCLLPEH